MKEIGYVAFYSNPKERTFYEKIVNLFDGGPYTHVELAVLNDDMTYTSYSASASRGGISKRIITFKSDNWTLFPVEVDRLKLENIYIEEMGSRYDFIGLLSTKIKWLGHSKTKWFCSELCAYMLEVPGKPHNFGVKSLFQYVSRYLTH